MIKTARRNPKENLAQFSEDTTLVKSEKKWVSPTFARTTDNPPYGNYPGITDGVNRTTLITSSYMQTTPDRQNKYLHKKCYYGDTLHDMPWIKSNIDLSFPDIKKIHLENEEAP
jgi:hypothetical protein